jgi:hypothetical protein
VNLSDILDAIGFLRGMTGNEYLANRWTFKRLGDSTLYTFQDLCIDFNVFFWDITQVFAKVDGKCESGSIINYRGATGPIYIGLAIQFEGHSTIYHVSSFGTDFIGKTYIILDRGLTATVEDDEHINCVYCDQSWYRFKMNDEAAGIIKEIATGFGLFSQVKYDPSNERMRMVFQHRDDPNANEIVLTKRKKSTVSCEWNNLFNVFNITYPLNQKKAPQDTGLLVGVRSKSISLYTPFFGTYYTAPDSIGSRYRLHLNINGVVHDIDVYRYLSQDGAINEQSWYREAFYALYMDLWSTLIIRETKEETYKGMGAEVDGDDKIAYMALANYVMDNNPGGVPTRYYIISLSRNPFTNEKRIKRVQLK